MISEDIKLFFKSRIDNVTEFLSGFGDDSFEEREETTGDIKFGGAEGSFGGFFIGSCKERNYVLVFGFCFELLVVVLLANGVEV